MSTPSEPARANGRSHAVPGPVRAGIAAVAALAPRLAARGLAELCLRPPRHPAPAHERAALRGVESFAVPHPGGVVRGWTRGRGPAVLLLHGWGGRSGQMAPLAEALVAAGCAAVAIDAPGHGRSSGRVASVPLYAGAIDAAARAMRIRAAIGHSFGGSALTFAAAQGLELEAAVIIGSPATPAVYVDQFCDALGLAPRVRRELRARLEARVGRRFEELELPRTIAAARMPALVVHDRADREVDFSNGEALARGCTPPPGWGTGASSAPPPRWPTSSPSWWSGCGLALIRARKGRAGPCARVRPSTPCPPLRGGHYAQDDRR